MTVSLSFHGAAGTVTCSCYLLQPATARVLIDCGLLQGSKMLKQLELATVNLPQDNPEKHDAESAKGRSEDG